MFRYLWKNAQLAGENGYIFKLFSFLCLQLVAVLHKTVKQVIDDICLENFHTDRIRHFLSIAFNFDIKGQNHGIPTKTINFVLYQ